MDQKAFESYLTQTGSLSAEPLQQLIRAHRQAYGDKAYLNEFFLGEEAFHQKRYENALKHYLKAGGVPLHNFFCFRASALLFQALNNPGKAREFALKGLALHATDPHLQNLVNRDALEPLQDLSVDPLANLEPDPMTRPKPDECPESIYEPLKENEMQTESDIFSSAHIRSEKAAQSLTARLYPDSQQEVWLQKDPLSKTEPSQEFLKNPTHSHEPLKDPWQELKRLATTDPFLGEDPLEQALKTTHRELADRFSAYLSQRERRQLSLDDELFCFNGWSGEPKSLWLSSHNWQGAGGFFIRWRGEGIVINPGRCFLDRFHAHGLHVRDIDRVLVTSSSPEICAGVEQLYRLNGKLNGVAHDVHLLHYYLQRDAFQNLSPVLKPLFKQERNNIHCLELFMDSPDVEKMELAPHLTLHYFPIQGSHIGIRLDLKGEKHTTKVGYLSGGAWNPLLAHHLGPCDLLIAAVGKIQLNDCHQVTYNNDSLGYNGCATLQQEIAPRLMLCGEFDGSEGDVRLPAIQKLRAALSPTGGALLPGENGLRLSLSSWAVQCNLSGQWVSPQKIKVAQTESAFAPLKYLAPNCCF